MKQLGKFFAIGCLAAAIGVLSSAQAEGSGSRAEALPAAKLQSRLQPEPEDKDPAPSSPAFQAARRQAIQKAAPQRVAPLNASLLLSPQSPYKKGAGYLKFESGVVDAREDTFGMREDAWAHIAFNMKTPNRRILLLVSGDSNQAGSKLYWAKGKMSASQTALISGTGPKVIPLLVQTEGVGKYTIVFRVKPVENKFFPFIFRSVEILDITS